MGDFLAPNPKRRDVVDRLRRRLENYRTHHNHSHNRYNINRVGLFEQQKHETELIHQKWLESKTKKTPKQSKAKDTGGGGGGGTAQSDHRNLVNKLKQKIDATSNNNDNASTATQQQQQQHQQQQQQPQGQSAQDNVFHFEDHDAGVTSQGNDLGGSLSSSTNVGVSGVPDFFVQIEQQISSQRKSPQTIHTSVRVSSTPFPSGGGLVNSEASPATHLGNSGSINIHTSTSTAQQAHGAGISTATTTNISAAPFKGSSNNNNNNNHNNNVANTVAGPSSSVQHASTETCVQSDIECKQEPEDSRDSLNAPGHSEVPDLPFDEIQTILDQIETDSSADLRATHANNPGFLRELDDFYQVLQKVTRSSSNGGGDLSLLSLDPCGSPGLSKAATLFPDTSPHQQLPVHSPSAITPTGMFEAPQPLGGMGVGGMAMRPVPSLAEPTGPAAEYLKQMAAQHQHQAAAAAAPTVFPGKGFADQYTDPYDHFGRNRNGYPPTGYSSQGYGPSAAATATAGYPGYGQSGYGDCSPGIAQYPGSKPELSSIGYSQTKPLTHYSGDGMGAPGTHGGQPGPPSSLQQLQNQVASHFNPMHITQTQHVQLGQGAHRLQLSQTQQMQMSAAASQQSQMTQSGAPPGMGVSQQQSFGMMNQGQPMNMREMQMMQEKIRREQQQQQQQQQQQYMTRPPPEYKMHPGARPPGPPYSSPSSGAPSHSQGGSNTPLQTMQNMVNQTPPYPSIKGEVGVTPGSNIGATVGPTGMTQMSAVQSMTASVNTGLGPNGGMNSSMAQASQSMAFQQQQQQPQRPPSYSPHAHAPTPTTPNGVVPAPSVCTTTAGAGVSNGGMVSGGGGGGGAGTGMAGSPSAPHPHSVASTASGNSQAPSSYTSALMRNQRPPNVNVGPEGLNISQPRAHLGHPGHMGHAGVAHPHAADGSWPRAAPGMGGHHPAQMSGRSGGPTMGSSPMAGMGQQSMMPPGYSHRPGSAGSVQGMGGMGGAGGQGHPLMGMGTQVMMHQNVQMTQQQQQHMAMRQSMGVPASSMPPSHSTYNPMAMQANGGHAAQQQQYSQGLSQQDDFMQQFFSSEQSATFDSLSSDLFEDILK